MQARQRTSEPMSAVHERRAFPRDPAALLQSVHIAEWTHTIRSSSGVGDCVLSALMLACSSSSADLSDSLASNCQRESSGAATARVQAATALTSPRLTKATSST